MSPLCVNWILCTRVDAFFDNKVGFEVDDLTPFKQSLGADHVRYYTDPTAEGGAQSMIMQLPGGILFQLIESSTSTTTKGTVAQLGGGR
jgi:hypothetical protein